MEDNARSRLDMDGLVRRAKLGTVSADHPPGSRRSVVVDGNNVIGARADGWWRDRPGAVRRLLSRLRCYRNRTGDDVVLALDVAQSDLPEGDHDGIAVYYPERPGRNAADERIVGLLEGDWAGPVEVVTSDRALADRARQRNATVVGASSFLARLQQLGC